MTGAPIVRIQGIGKRFHVQKGWKDLLLRPTHRELRMALEDVSIEVARGEFFGLLGQNGAGKTTLFKILATLILPDEGTVEVDGIDVAARPDAVRRILVPVIPSERSLYWRVSAKENLRLYAALQNLRGSEIPSRVDEALEIVDLGDVGSKQVGLFSSGMKQRLLIARALLGRPKVLLLDEPTRSLDPVSARDFRRFLRERIGREYGSTVLLATHDHEEVTELCTRVGVLDRGRLLAVGDTDRLLAGSNDRVIELQTTQPEHPEIAAALERYGGQRLEGSDSEPTVEGWYRVRVQAPLDESGSWQLLKELVQAEVPVSQYAPRGLSLADLLESVGKPAGRNEGLRE